MNPFEISEHIAACLDEDSIPYAIGGALALTAWAMPRTTKDVDISVFAPEQRLPEVFDALERAGIMIDRVDATRAVARIGMFTGRHGRTNVDVFVSQHPHFIEMQRRRTQLASPSGALLWFVSAEDLVILKLLFARSKDVPDLEWLFAAIALDRNYVRSWLSRMLPASDRRFELLDDLEDRFAKP